jgi:hypothetical protein
MDVKKELEKIQEYYDNISDEDLKINLQKAGFNLILDKPGQIIFEEEEEYKPIWSKIKNDFIIEDMDFVITHIETEENYVIARVICNKYNKRMLVEYYDERAKTDINAQKYIEEVKNKLKEIY